MHKDLRRLVRTATREGFVLTPTPGHYKLRKNTSLVVISKSFSDSRGIMNAARDIKRAIEKERHAS